MHTTRDPVVLKSGVNIPRYVQNLPLLRYKVGKSEELKWLKRAERFYLYDISENELFNTCY